MIKKFKKCPYCNGKIFKKYTGLKDRLDTTTRTFSCSECTVCGAGFLNPMPIGNASKYYPANYLSGEVSQIDHGLDSQFDLEKWYRYNQYRYDFKLFYKSSDIKTKDIPSYLDIGCGSGERVAYIYESGCKNANGIDRFDFAKHRSRMLGKIINSEVSKYFPKSKYNVISLFHVLEHIEYPHKLLNHIRKNLLTNAGYLIVQVPNYDSLERKIFGRKWFCFDSPRHLWQFNEAALKETLEKAGYKIIGTYKTNAPLHPVSIVPSIFRELDVQRIWANKSRGKLYKRLMMLLWVVLTIMTIPLVIIQNAFKSSSMLTVVAKIT